MSEQQFATFEKGNVHSIKIVGNADFVKERIDTLVMDFNEPKFGWSGEDYDEYDDEI